MEHRVERQDQVAGAEGLWKRCRGCGRQFRSAVDTGGSDVEYCPVCDYRRLRKQLDEANPDPGEVEEADE